MEVYFEKENIYTLDSKGELLITIMSSLAQEESRSISENVTWRQRKRFADGKVSLPYKKFLGYEKGPDGLPKIVSKQAETVKLIYSLFLEGMMPSTIAGKLTQRGILTPSGKTRWASSTVESILTNEKYKGDALLQKTFCTDFLTKKMKVNEGEVPQYYVEHSHPAIIAPEVFDEVQAELTRRREAKYTSRSGAFSSRIICGECGSYYGPKVWHSNDKYRRVIWRCNHKYAGGNSCSTPHLDEDTIKTAFVVAFNSLITCKGEIIAEYRGIVDRRTDISELERENTAMQDECERLVDQIQRIITKNARQPLDQDEYNHSYTELVVRYDAVKKKLEENESHKLAYKTKRERLTDFIGRLDSREGLLIDFDEGLWNATVESVTVRSVSEVTFAFKGGVTLDWAI